MIDERLPQVDTGLPRGAALHRRYKVLTTITSAISLAVISGYLVSLLSLTQDQWSSFFTVLVIAAPLFTGIQWTVIDPRMWAPLKAALDAHHDGTLTPELRKQAFSVVVGFPYHTFRWGVAWFAIGGVVLAGWLYLRTGITGYSAIVIITAAVTGGFVGVMFHAFSAKELLRPVREHLADAIGDPEGRGDLIRHLSLRAKLITSVTAVTLVVVLFAVFLAQVRASRAIESFAVRQQAILLARVAPMVQESLDDIEITDEIDAQDIGFVILSEDGARIVEGPTDALTELERSVVAAEVEPFGDSSGFDSTNAFAWQRLWDGRVLVAYASWEDLVAAGASDMRGLFAALFVVATLIALGLGVALARDICAATQAVGDAAARIAAGDLRAGSTYDSEDELGDLARSFERMQIFLRGTVGAMAEAADRVENAASEFASVGDAVTAATTDQRDAIRAAGESMDRVRTEVQGIADSAQSLNTFMEESSSSVAELGAVGEELSQNAGILSGKVEESSSSVEQMIRSVREVATNSEGLHEAASETSSSMEEMAASMREVETNASETARLSSQVAEMAEQGQDKVRQTIEGMYAIREATDTAQAVIQDLGSRVKDIGAIVEVIDDVADETNLLALNAAIIAAQAGEHGRSFSVVADEIKELADRVLASTKEIDGQIRSVQQESANAVGAIERGSVSVQSGVDLSAEAGVALERITEATRGSGDRITEIVSAVQEQSKASTHVVELMDRVREGVDQIRRAGQEQERSNQVVLESCTTMRDVSEQVRSTTDEQSRGSRRIGEAVESVRSAVDQINRSLQSQTSACGDAAELLTRATEQTGVNQESTERMSEAMRGLVRQAETLRESAKRFRL